MIRIDHVLGLMRSYWIPAGATEGAYVSYPLDALLAVVAIESVRCRTIVVGEDLGLVSAGFREKLEASGVYGLDVLQFQWDRNRGFEDTARSRAKAICTFATHDTADDTPGFLRRRMQGIRAKLGLLDDDGLDRIRAERRAARRSLGDTPAVPEIHRRLARARSEMVAVQLDDIAGQRSQQNLPGTIDGYPNWRRSAPFTTDAIRNSPSFAQLGSDMRAQGRGKRIRRRSSMKSKPVRTTPIDGQKPGTSGLRQKTSVFRRPRYLENYVQSVFDGTGGANGKTYVLGGDGRFSTPRLLTRSFAWPQRTGRRG